jgi:hypothetical protein
MATAAGGEVCRVHRWALNVQGCSKHNKATCALVNKHARICYAKLRDHAPLDEAAARLPKKTKPAELRHARLIAPDPFTHTSYHLATGLIDHHGQPGSSHTALRR